MQFVFFYYFNFFFSEKTVEHFSLFLQTMEENLTRMKAKFIDHCNKMSGREQCTYCQYCAIIACILTLNKFSKRVLKIIIKLLTEIIIINAIINIQIHFNNTPQCQNAKYNNAQCVLQSNYVLIFPLFLAFMAEHHKMAAVVAGLGHCFELENKECEYIMCTHTHARAYCTCTLTCDGN